MTLIAEPRHEMNGQSIDRSINWEDMLTLIFQNEFYTPKLGYKFSEFGRPRVLNKEGSKLCDTDLAFCLFDSLEKRIESSSKMKSSIFILALVVIVAIYVQPSEAIFDRIKCNTIAGLCQGCQRAEYDHHLFKVGISSLYSLFSVLLLSISITVSPFLAQHLHVHWMQ